MTDARITRVTVSDVETGESETIDVNPGQYIVICDRARYVASDMFYPTTGTNVITIKTLKGEAES